MGTVTGAGRYAYRRSTAEAAWRTLLALEPASTPHRLGLGSALLRQGRNAEALALVEDLLARERLDAPIWLLHGQVLHAAGKSVEAEAAYRQATELDPWLLQAYSSLALLLQERGDFGAAASIWSRLSGLYPANTAFRYLLVRAHLQAGQPERAYLALARLPAEEAASATALHWSGIALGALGRPLDAIAALRPSIAAQNPAAAQSWIALSILLGELQRYPEAIAAASNALSLQSDSRESRFWLAVHLKDGGRGNEALAVTEGLVASDAADPGGWRQHGFALALLGRRKEAIQALERSLELDPKQGKVWAALVEVCHADGQEVAARRAYEHLRSVDPEYARKTYQTVIATYEEQGL